VQSDQNLKSTIQPGAITMNNPTPVASQNAPKPLSLHWAIVLVLSIVTLGLFTFLWIFRQARFARKIDTSSKAMGQIAMSFVLVLSAILFNAVNAITVARGGESTNLGITGSVMSFFTLFMFVSGYLEIRRALTTQYGIQMSAVLTVIFNVFYVQYHLSRIVRLQCPRTPQLPNAIPPVAEAGRANA
jgi:hypothetical protein